MPDNVLYMRCGNRRASVCPSCSHEYEGDMWHLLSAGVTGGSKGVPDSVAEHPMVFATLTAPSFGPVHTASTPSSRRRCHPRAPEHRCVHGVPTSCIRRHDTDQAVVGEPICRDCYDYDGHIVWQWWAPKLWRCFTIAVRRLLASRLGMSENKSRQFVRLQFAKVAEYQRRDAIHFHALIRLDSAPIDGEPFQVPGAGFSASLLAEVVKDAARAVAFEAPAIQTGRELRVIRFGAQIDSRPVCRDSQSSDVSPRMVTAYLAKYATKSVDDLVGPEDSTRTSAHLTRLRLTAETLGRLTDDERYKHLKKWSRMLGFRGHFATKSRSFSTTMGALRQARRDYFRGDDHDDRRDSDESTLVVGDWRFIGMGWLTPADEILATATSSP